MELNSPKNESLENIQQENEDINGLVAYSSEGGGDISLRVSGIRRKIVVSKQSHKEISIEEVFIKGRNPKEIAEIIQNLLK